MTIRRLDFFFFLPLSPSNKRKICTALGSFRLNSGQQPGSLVVGLIDFRETAAFGRRRHADLVRPRITRTRWRGASVRITHSNVVNENGANNAISRGCFLFFFLSPCPRARDTRKTSIIIALAHVYCTSYLPLRFPSRQRPVKTH